jgi:hypothetical protein
MKLHNVFQIVLGLSLITASLTGCQLLSKVVQGQFVAQSLLPWQNKSRPVFHTDEQLLSHFQAHKAEMIDLMQECKAQKNSGGAKLDTAHPFISCASDQARLKTLSVKEVAQEIQQRNAPPGEFEGSRMLLVTDYYKNDPGDTFIEEKGYVYSPTPIRRNVVKTGALDQFSGQELIDKQKNREVWKYKQIAPNWYLYYRQFFYTFLH